MFSNILKQIRSITDKPLTVFDWVMFFVTAAGCFFIFQQGGILHTGGSSITYLCGHFLDFYDYNVKPMIGNNYLPSSYILYAIWNIPLKLFGIVPEPTMSVGFWTIMWYKVLPVGFYLATAIVIYKICNQIGFGSLKSKLCAFAWLVSPIAFFSQFIFGQYDIFTVFFMLIGMYFYYKGGMTKFILFFSIAITFKYFPLFIFIPLLLLREKNKWNIVRSMAFVMIPFALEVLIYIASPAFKTGVFGFGATSFILKPAFCSGMTEVSIFVLSILILFIWAYFIEPKNDKDLVKWGLYISNIVLFLLFGLSFWHPQWLLFAVPFWTISTFISKKFDLFILLDIAMMLFFIIYTVNTWTNHVDQHLFTLGALSDMSKNIDTLTMRKLFLFTDRKILFTLFSAMVLANAVFKHPKLCVDNFAEPIEKYWWMIRVKFIVGIAIFLIPALVSFIVAQMV